MSFSAQILPLRRDDSRGSGRSNTAVFVDMRLRFLVIETLVRAGTRHRLGFRNGQMLGHHYRDIEMARVPARLS